MKPLITAALLASCLTALPGAMPAVSAAEPPGAQAAPALPGNLADRIATLRGQLEKGFPRDWKPADLEDFIQQIWELPADDKRRLEVIELAKSYARPPELAAKARGVADYRLDERRLEAAWKILRELNVIYDNMKADDLVAVLGKPNRTDKNSDGQETWSWYYNSPMHVNPCLNATVRGNRIISIKELVT